jgi:hypothetical protein
LSSPSILCGMFFRTGRSRRKEQSGERQAAAHQHHHTRAWRAVLLPPAAAEDAWSGAAVHLLLLDAGAGVEVALAAARALQQAASRGMSGGAAAPHALCWEPAGLVVACVGRERGGGSSRGGSVVKEGAGAGDDAGAGVPWWAVARRQLRRELRHTTALQVVEEPLLLAVAEDGADEQGREEWAEAEVATARLPAADASRAGSEYTASVAFSRRRGAGLGTGWVGVAALGDALRAAVEEHNERLAKRVALLAAA